MNIGKTSPFQSNFTPFQIIYGTHLLYKRRLETWFNCDLFKNCFISGKKYHKLANFAIFCFFPRYLPPEKIFESFSFDRII